MKAVKNIFLKLGILGELINFFWQQKLWWLIPFVIILAIVGILIVFAQTSAIAPFVYTIF